MDFHDAVDLFNYWNDSPTIRMVLHSYFEIEPAQSAGGTANDAMAMSQAMKMMGGGKAEKLDRAPAKDRERFLALKAQLAEMKTAKR